MAALSEHKLDIVRTLVETAPDKVVDGLHAALASASGETALASVRRIVEGETRDRQLRNIVLAPIAPLCVGDGRAADRLVFPARVLALIWRGLKAQAPSVVRKAELALFDYRPGTTTAEHFDRLVRVAAKSIRAGEQADFKAVAELCDEARPGGADALLGCLDLAPVVRDVAHRLPDWAAHQTEDTTIGARLAYKDAVAISADAGPRFFQMLAGQLEHDWMVLRIISAIMERPTDSYLAETELGVFGERVLNQIEAALVKIQKIDLDGGAPAAAEAAALVDRITIQANELETFVSLSREHGWGHTLTNHRKALAAVVEGRLRECEKQFQRALPSGRARLKRIRRSIPRLNLAPDEAAVGRCETLLVFVRDVRHSANYGGFASARSKLIETLGEQLDLYVEELLDLVKTGEAENPDHARAFLAVATTFSGLIRDDKAADLVRRRGVAAFTAAPAPAAEPKLATGT